MNGNLTKLTRLNLASKKGMEAFSDGLINHGEQEPHLVGSRFEDFMKTFDHPMLGFGDAHLLFLPEGSSILIRNRRVFVACSDSTKWSAELHQHDQVLNSSMDRVGGVLIVDCQRRVAGNEGFRGIVLVNGDMDSWDGSWLLHNVDGFDSYYFPTISFECLARFFDSGTDAVVKMLANGPLSVKDFTADERVDLNAEEKKLMRKKNGRSKLVPPGTGFTLVGDHSWHRPGFVLIYDERGDRSLLFGQDDETYFGCQLQNNCETVADALDSLIPPTVRGSGVIRQGEWFLVPVPEEDVPSENDSLLVFSSVSDAVWMPREKGGKEHFLGTHDGRVGQDGIVYANEPYLDHEEHGRTQSTTGWYKLVRNTAVKSFSQEGVD